jgi:hypothetical protein
MRTSWRHFTVLRAAPVAMVAGPDRFDGQTHERPVQTSAAWMPAHVAHKPAIRRFAAVACGPCLVRGWLWRCQLQIAATIVADRAFEAHAFGVRAMRLGIQRNKACRVGASNQAIAKARNAACKRVGWRRCGCTRYIGN